MFPGDLKDEPITLALSGGGFRATLYSLGALLYLVDSGEHEHVRSIRSVSGASVLNAMVAQSFDFSKATVHDIDEVAVRLLRVVTGRGLLFSSGLTMSYLATIGLGTTYLMIEAVFDAPLDLPWWVLLPGFAALASVFILRGLLLTRLLRRQFFQRKGRATRLSDIETSVQHVIFSTDLNSGGQAAFSAGGEASPQIWTSLGNAAASEVTLDRAVRASAAFPGGVPPLRLRLKDFGLEWRDRTQRLKPHWEKGLEGSTRQSRLVRIAEKLGLSTPTSLYLADGGVRNNLATDRVRGLEAESSGSLFVVDASAPMASSALRHLSIPGVAEIGALARSMAVLSSNTVEPRILELEIRSSALVERRLDASFTGGGEIPIVIRITEYRSGILKRGKRIAEMAGHEFSRDEIKRESKRTSRVWSDVSDYLNRQWQVRYISATASKTPTTFGQIKRPEALGLVLLGYLSAMTALCHYRQAPFGSLDMARFERLLDGHAGQSIGYIADEWSEGDTAGETL